jgi:hypothetical protein
MSHHFGYTAEEYLQYDREAEIVLMLMLMLMMSDDEEYYF